MPRVDQSTINWAVYEDNTEYAGMAQATLPNLTALTQSISGAGIAGNVDAVILGHFDAMSMTLNYRTMTEQAVRLSEPRRHNIDLRYAVQDEDPVAAAVQIRAIKHIDVLHFVSLLSFLPYSDKIEGGRGKAPGSPLFACGVKISCFGRWLIFFFYALIFLLRTISAAS